MENRISLLRLQTEERERDHEKQNATRHNEFGLGSNFTRAAQRTLAQHSHDHGGGTSWKTGMLRLSHSAWARDVRLKSGMYHVKHIVEGNTHVIVFKPVTLPGGKGFPMWEEKEVARMECRVESAAKSVSNTKVVSSKTDAGERSIQEIQIAGENVRHILLPDTSVSQQTNGLFGLRQKSQEAL